MSRGLHREIRVSLVTEGTYPYVVGGVSSWCQDLVSGLPEIQWQLVPITAGGLRRTSVFDIPEHAQLTPGIELWSRPALPRRLRRSRPDQDQHELPARICRLLLGADEDQSELIELFGRCRQAPRWARGAFRSKEAWQLYADQLHLISRAEGGDLYTDVDFSVLEAAELWQTLYWLAMTAATPLPEADVVLLTAAGWGAVMAAAEKEKRETPILLTEHGLYVREAYLEASRSAPSPGRGFSRTRLARGLSRLSYTIADRITPVSSSHHAWETHLGADPAKLQTIVNGVATPEHPPAPAGQRIIASVGRIDPLKDVVTMLHTAAHVCAQHPDATFAHWGPVADENAAYFEMCQAIHAQLGLGDRFVFHGPTTDPRAAMREADIYLSTSISEGLPLSVLEAMTEARPVVATDVGGCAEAVLGCGVLASAGDHHALAHGISFLLDNPDFAEMMGRRGFRRAARHYSAGEQLRQYRSTIETIAG